MKFRVIKENPMGARLGILKINGKKAETPLLWLSCSIRNKPYPWKYFEVNAVMVNAYELIKKGILVESIHKFLGINGLIMMDSGGFQILRRKVRISPSEIIRVYKKAKPDIGVVLDYPLDPSDLSSWAKRWRKTLINTKFMLDNSYDVVLMPVIHGYTIDDIRKACKEIKDITDPKIIGIGSMVPIVRQMYTSKLLELNNVTTFKLIVETILTVRREFSDAFLHVFGIGSVTTMHLMFSLGVDSVDSMSWRIKAAYGAIQLPRVNDRFISPKDGRKPLKEIDLLSKCKCPICNGKSLEDRKIALDNSRPNTFYNRAIHNAYVLKQEEFMFRKFLTEGKVIEFIRSRLQGTRYHSLINWLTNKKLFDYDL